MSLKMKQGIPADHLRRRINLAIPPTYRKWPQLLIDTKNCIYQRLENVVISAMMSHYQAPDFSVIP